MFISADKPGSGCLHIAGYPLATTDGRDDRNLRSVGDGTRESTCISDIFVPNENIDMLPQLSLLRRDAISNTRVECPQSGQRVGQSCGRVFDLDFAAPASKVAQSTRNVKITGTISSSWSDATCASTEISIEMKSRSQP